MELTVKVDSKTVKRFSDTDSQISHLDFPIRHALGFALNRKTSHVNRAVHIMNATKVKSHSNMITFIAVI